VKHVKVNDSRVHKHLWY